MNAFSRILLAGVVAAPVMLAGLTGCSSDNNTASTTTAGTLKYDPSPCTIAKGSTNQFHVQETFPDASKNTALTNSDLTFKSEGTDNITVDANGNFNGVSVGTATITITAKDGASVSLDCTCT